jgi:uncharacterized protein YqiB (DUF1249 family)
VLPGNTRQYLGSTVAAAAVWGGSKVLRFVKPKASYYMKVMESRDEKSKINNFLLYNYFNESIPLHLLQSPT